MHALHLRGQGLPDGEEVQWWIHQGVLSAEPVAGAETVFDGGWIIPGLVDSHVHLATPPDRRKAEAVLRRNLYGGVTMVRDMADDLRSVGELARASRVGEIPAPDIYYAAIIAGPASVPRARSERP